MLSNLEATYKPNALDARALNELVLDTFLRQGRFDIADSFIQVA